jgi:hypothetical protein
LGGFQVGMDAWLVGWLVEMGGREQALISNGVTNGVSVRISRLRVGRVCWVGGWYVDDLIRPGRGPACAQERERERETESKKEEKVIKNPEKKINRQGI